MTTGLQVEIAAKWDQYQRDLQRIGEETQKKIDEIEKQFADLNPQLSKMTSNTLAAFGLGAAAGIGGGLVAFLVEASHQMADLEDGAKRLGLSLERLQEIRFVGGVGGLDPKKLTDGLEAMAGLLNDAQRNENSLTKLLDANNIQFKNRNGELIDFNKLLEIAIGLITNAKTQLDKVDIAKMLGVSKELVPILDKGKQSFEAVAASAHAAGAIIDDETIKKAAEFDREWSRVTAEWSSGFRGALSQIVPLLNDLVGGAVRILGGLGAFYNFIKSATPPGEQTLDQLTDRVAQLQAVRDAMISGGPLSAGQSFMKGWLVGSGADQTAVENAIAQAKDLIELRKASNLPQITITPGGTNIPGRDTGGTGRDFFDTASDRVERRAAALQAEADTIDKGTAARERARVVAELETVAVQANIAAKKDDTSVSAEQRARISEVADAYARAALAIERARYPLQAFARDAQSLEKVFNTFAADSLNTFNSTLVNSIGTATTLGEVFHNVGLSIMRDLAMIALKAAEAPIASALGAGLASAFGIPAIGIGGVGETGPALGKFIVGPGRAGGGDVVPGVAYPVNENTPNSEIFVPKVAGTIYPANVLKGGAAAGGDINVNLAMDLTGVNGEESMARIARAAATQAFTAGVRTANEQFPARQLRLRMLGT